jgi:hypothetical protein
MFESGERRNRKRTAKSNDFGSEQEFELGVDLIDRPGRAQANRLGR